MILRAWALVDLAIPSLLAVESRSVERGSAEELNRKKSWAFTPDPALPNVLILERIAAALPAPSALANPR